MTKCVEVTAGRERVDRALLCFSSLVLVPVKILPLPVEVRPRIACCTMAMSPATREEGSKIRIRKRTTKLHCFTNSKNQKSLINPM